METFTADDARKLMPRDEQALIDEIVEKAHEKIKAAAEKGYDKVRFHQVGYAYKNPEDVVGTEIARADSLYGYKNKNDRTSNAALKALAVLEEEGFDVSYVYEERQFVDLGFLISW